MTLERHIINSIYNYPSLYYKDTYENSRKAVLNHIFLVLGNGYEYIENEKLFGSNSNSRIKLNDKQYEEVRKKIIENVPLICFSKISKDSFSSFIVSSDYHGKLGSVFKDNFKGNLDNYPRVFSETKNNKSPHNVCYEIYPDTRDTILGQRYKWKPYPFSFYYLPFVEINPNYKKYTYHNIHEMTVEELRESIPLIRNDWCKGIVEIFQYALDFFKGKDYDNDPYYKQSVRLEELRNEYISICEKVINAFK